MHADDKPSRPLTIQLIALRNETETNRQENDKEMVSNLLAFRARLDVTVDKACDANESYRYKLKEAWEGFLNARYCVSVVVVRLDLCY